MGVFLPIMMGVSAIASAISQRIAAKQSRQNTNRTISANLAQSELAYQREKSGISEQNLYNTPTMQMARFKQAGLNPNLIYSQGSPGQQITFPKYQAPTLDYSKNLPYFDPGSALSKAVSTGQQIQSLQNAGITGNILRTKDIMTKAMRPFAEQLALTSSENAMNQEDMIKFQRIFAETKLETMFDLRNGEWYLKPGYEEIFTSAIIADLSKQELQNTLTGVNIRKGQQDVLIKMKINELQNMGLPWMQPILNFLRLLSGR